MATNPVFLARRRRSDAGYTRGVYGWLGLGGLFAPACLSMALLACRTVYPGDHTARPASDVPDVFLIDDRGELLMPSGSMYCRNPMVDTRDGYRLVLERSQAGRGDYRVSAGRYGVRPEELLRIDCGSGKTIGIVRR